MIERDKEDMDKCLTSNLHKSVLLLAGSIIEAILVDYFLAFTPSGFTDEQILQVNLSKLIDLAEQENLISTRTKEISTVVRNYRNLIHPGKEYRINERVDSHSANVAAHLVEIIVEEINETYSKKLGYKAEAAIKKIIIDPSCSSIFKHMVEQMSTIEKVKLFRLIPKICLEKNISEGTIDNFITLHSFLSDIIISNKIKEETSKIIDFLNYKGRDETLLYLRFYIKHLNLLSPNEIETTIIYILSLLDDADFKLLQKIDKIVTFKFGEYIDNEKKRKYIIDATFDRLNSIPIDTFEEDEIFLNILNKILDYLPFDFIDQIKMKLTKVADTRAQRWLERIENISPF